MKTITIQYADRSSEGWGADLVRNGYERDQFENKYNKKIVTWSKDGVTYTCKPSTVNGDLVLTLTPLF